jgi:hypothetical protein
MKKINSIEDALLLFEENTIKRGEALSADDFKTYNKYLPTINKCIVYLYDNQQLNLLYKFLKHNNHYVRSLAAYALLPLFENECVKVLNEIANGNYGFLSINAEKTLKEWKEGRLEFLFISNLQTYKQQLLDEYQRKFAEENDKEFKRRNKMSLLLLIPWGIAMIVCLITGQLLIGMFVLALLFIIAYPMNKWIDRAPKDVKKKLDLWYQQMVKQQTKSYEVEESQLKAQPMVYPAFESFAMADMESIVGEKDVCVAFYEYYGDHLYYIHYVDDKAKEIFVENAESHEIVSFDYDELDEYYQQLEGLSEMLDSLEVAYVGTISMEDFKSLKNHGVGSTDHF